MDPSASILYYPTIEFHDPGWLKNALCVWEHVYRIVPAGYQPQDSDEVKQAVEEGIVRNIALSQADLTDAADEFTRFWKLIPFAPAGLDSDGLTTRLHPDKVDARIRPVLEMMARKVDVDGWLHLPEEVANGYMLFLAETASRRRGMPKLTDSSDIFSIMHYFTNDGNFDEWVCRNDATEVTTSMVLTTVIPAGVARMSMKDVLGFRRGSADGRQTFRETVTRCAREFSRIEERNHAVQLALDLQQRLLAARDSLGKTILRLGQNVAYAVIAVGVPTLLTAVSAFAGEGDPFASRRWGAAGLVAVVAALADAARTRRHSWDARDASYYLQLRSISETTNGIHLQVPSFHKIFEEFIND